MVRIGDKDRNRRNACYKVAIVQTLASSASQLTARALYAACLKVVPAGDSSRVGYNQVQSGFGKGAPGALQILTTQRGSTRVVTIARADRGVAQVMPPMLGANGSALVQVIPMTDPSATATGATVDRLRAALPAGSLVAGSARNLGDG